MTTDRNRRAVLQSAGAWALTAAALREVASSASARAQTAPAQEAPAAAATAEHVKRVAQQLAAKAYVKPALADLPEPFSKLTYDQYRDIRFRSEQAIWRGEKLDYELQLFALGYLYDAPVEVWIVEESGARLLRADGTLFSVGPLIPNAPQAAPFAFSGFRVHGPINRADYFDEFLVFQGASYYRAVGRGEGYGASARGLAINTAKPPGEEFPLFRTFWIEKPKPGINPFVVHALLDSPSTTGAYRFSVQPGASTIMDIDVTLYPRRDLTHVGLGPLTSMFLHGPAYRRNTSDFRPAVHDSEGLAILNGNGERIWRPLTNPRLLQVSAFIDKDPKGFGLSQRDRSFANYEDLEAQYQSRPTVWVEPKGGWGDGYIELIEIPAEEEIHDNIVAFWRPARPIEAAKPYAYAYRLHWGEAVPIAWSGARVRKTRVGANRRNGVLFVIDFDGPALKDAKELPVADVRASAGTLQNVVVHRHPEIGGLRCTFELMPGGSELIELRLVLKSNEQIVSESWLYRWTKS